jgi:hypothetical protein
MRCHIRIKGYLDPIFQDWFEGLAIVHEDEGTSRLSGSRRRPGGEALASW